MARTLDFILVAMGKYFDNSNKERVQYYLCLFIISSVALMNGCCGTRQEEGDKIGDFCCGSNEE